MRGLRPITLTPILSLKGEGVKEIVLHLNLKRVRKYAVGGEAWPWRRLPD